MAEVLAGLADLGVYLLFKVSITADDTAKILEVVHRLQLGAADGDGRKMGDSGMCRLE